MDHLPDIPEARRVKTITVITPCFNAEKYIEETIHSVINQSAVKEGRLALNYWVIDGGSSDRTVEIVKRYESQGVSLISEKDAGMYDALVKGFARAKGDACCYINAGDYFHPQAFDVVKDVFEAQPDVKWLTGMAVKYNERSQVIHFYLPKRFFRRSIRRGYYGRVQPHIQQESTFWRTELLQLVDMDKLRKLRYAGDFLLWHSFSQRHDLIIVASQLGGFKVHAGQLSSAMDKYTRELEEICGTRLGWLDRLLGKLDKLAMLMPSRSFLIPIGYDKVVRWDYKHQCWSTPGQITRADHHD